MYGIEGLLAGRTLVDRYHVLEVIGRGGMGAVYRARDERLGREVAVKVVTVAAPDRDAHARLRARFHREARSAAQLHHPHVVAVHDFGTDPALQLDFLVMELLRGEDLATRMYRRGPPPAPEALRILYQAACGLAAGHRAGLIHRDVKPGNLFLEPGDRVGELRVKVLDFGIAEIAASDEATLTHLTLAGRSPFSPAFASPEQLRGEARLSPTTDVFSLGAVGYQLFTGERAFVSTEPRQMLVEVSAALAALRERAPGLPPALRDGLRRALAPHPDDRFPDAAVLADELEPLLAGRGTTPSRPPGGAERPARRTEARERGGEEGDEATRLLDDAPAGPPPAPTDQRTRFAPTRQRLAPELEALLQRAPAPPARGEQASAAPREGWFRRTTRAVWNFLLTTAAVGLFAACWFGVVTGLEQGSLELVYGAAVASVFSTPLMLHRLLRHRGSYRFALLASALGSIATIYLLAGSESIETVLITMLIAQVVLSFGAEQLTLRAEPGTDPRAGPEGERA